MWPPRGSLQAPAQQLRGYETETARAVRTERPRHALSAGGPRRIRRPTKTTGQGMEGEGPHGRESARQRSGGPSRHGGPQREEGPGIEKPVHYTTMKGPDLEEDRTGLTVYAPDRRASRPTGDDRQLPGETDESSVAGGDLRAPLPKTGRSSGRDGRGCRSTQQHHRSAGSGRCL